MTHLVTISASGSDYTDATSIAETTSDWTVVLVNTSASGQGVGLPNATVGDMVELHKGPTGSDAFHVYRAGSTIDGVSGSTGVGPILNGFFRYTASGEWHTAQP